MNQPQYNDKSLDAVVTRIIDKLDEQDRRFEDKCTEDRLAFKAIMDKQDVTNGRVTKLENWRISSKTRMATYTFLIATFGAGAATWFVEKFLIKTS